MNTILIDDEPAAIASLSRLIKKYSPDLEIVGTADNITAGLEMIERLRPDLIFLDIEMPGGSGFDLVRQLTKDKRPEIIFATSQESYAMDAIRCAALGYLVKPVIDEQLIEAVQHARQRVAQKNSHQRMQALLDNLTTPGASTNRIGVPSETGVDFVEAGRITHCEGVEGCTRIHVDNGKPFLSSYSLGEYRAMLKPYNFLLTHRSFLVGLPHVRRYDRSGSLLLSTGVEVPVGRRRKQEVLDWISNSVIER